MAARVNTCEQYKKSIFVYEQSLMNESGNSEQTEVSTICLVLKKRTTYYSDGTIDVSCQSSILHSENENPQRVDFADIAI